MAYSLYKVKTSLGYQLNYVVAADYNEAAEKVKKHLEEREGNKPVLTKEGDLNPQYLANIKDVGIKILEIELLTDDLI